jgi:hypothetical protein
LNKDIISHSYFFYQITEMICPDLIVSTLVERQKITGCIVSVLATPPVVVENVAA